MMCGVMRVELSSHETILYDKMVGGSVVELRVMN